MKVEQRLENYRRIRKYNKVSFFAPEKKKLRIFVLVILLFVISVAILLSVVKENLSIEVREIDIAHAQIPTDFEG